jgi:hypothetical protein
VNIILTADLNPAYESDIAGDMDPSVRSMLQNLHKLRRFAEVVDPRSDSDILIDQDRVPIIEEILKGLNYLIYSDTAGFGNARTEVLSELGKADFYTVMQGALVAHNQMRKVLESDLSQTGIRELEGELLGRIDRIHDNKLPRTSAGLIDTGDIYRVTPEVIRILGVVANAVKTNNEVIPKDIISPAEEKKPDGRKIVFDLLEDLPNGALNPDPLLRPLGLEDLAKCYATALKQPGTSIQKPYQFINVAARYIPGTNIGGGQLSGPEQSIS